MRVEREKSRVYIVRAESPVELGVRVMETVSPKPEGIVLIKPNITLPFSPETGLITHPQLVEGVIQYLKELDGVEKILVGDGSGDFKHEDMEEAFRISGYRDLATRNLSIELVNLNREETVEIQIPGSQRMIPIAKAVLDCDYLIDVPTLKPHRLAIVTLGIKNLMGCIVPPPKKGELMHPLFNRIYQGKRVPFSEKDFDTTADELALNLCDLAKAFYEVNKPNLVIIDGFVGRDGTGLDEEYGGPKNMRVVIGGKNLVAVDTVGAEVMGIDPRTVPHLVKAGEAGLGPNNLSEIQIVGPDIEEIRKKFRVVTFKEIK